MKRIVNKVGNLPCIFLLYFYKILKINNLDFACKKNKNISLEVLERQNRRTFRRK